MLVGLLNARQKRLGETPLLHAGEEMELDEVAAVERVENPAGHGVEEGERGGGENEGGVGTERERGGEFARVGHQVALVGEEREYGENGGQTGLQRGLQERLEVRRKRLRVLRVAAVGARRDDGERRVEVVAPHLDGRLVDLQLLLALVNLRVQTVQRAQRRLRAQCLQVRAGVAVGALRQVLDHLLARLRAPRPCVDAQNLLAPLGVGQVEEQLAVEASGASQRGVDGVHAVGGADHDDLPATVQSVHEREQRRDDGAVDLVLLGGAHGRQAVDLVEEDHGGLVRARLVEQQSQLLLRLAHPLGETVRALPHEERDALAALHLTAMMRADH